jgi:hypothetical protein
MRRVTIVLDGKEVWRSEFHEEMDQRIVQELIRKALKEHVLDVGGGEFEVIDEFGVTSTS